MKKVGILLPVFSLPNKYGIGSLGKEAFEFIDFLAMAKQDLWQVLPSNPTSYGDSPYQSFSTFAGNPYFIDLDILVEEGLLEQEELDEREWGEEPAKVDYGTIYGNRFTVLRQAFARSSHADTKDFKKFEQDNAYWLSDYCLFMALKGEFKGKSWTD